MTVDKKPDKTKRRVTLAKEVGFCFGVKRAINLTKKALNEREDVFIVGDLVHNKSVTDELESRGLRKLNDLNENHSSGTMVIRAHGIPKINLKEAQDRGLEIVNATCPIVMRAQDAARNLENRGCQVVIIGDRNHAEIKGIMGALDQPALVIDSIEELRTAQAEKRLKRKVGVIFQTTHALELCQEIVNELVFLCKEIQIINTICRPVQMRQDDALELAEKVDVMLVIGSSTSANTQELAALCRQHNPYTLTIQSVKDLADEDIIWAEHIGIASGLSTPEDLVEEVRQSILNLDYPIDQNRKPDPARYISASPLTHAR